jgi:hypothetical protein
MVSSPPLVFLSPDFLGAAFLPPAAAPLFFGAILAIGNGSLSLASAVSAVLVGGSGGSVLVACVFVARVVVVLCN